MGAIGSTMRPLLLLLVLVLAGCNEHSTEPTRHVCAITVSLDTLKVRDSVNAIVACP